MESSSDTSGGVVQDVGITMNDVNTDYVVVGEGRSYSLDIAAMTSSKEK